jgi:hypothetical protein
MICLRSKILTSSSCQKTTPDSNAVVLGDVDGFREKPKDSTHGQFRGRSDAGFIEGNGLSDEDVAIMEPVEEQVGEGNGLSDEDVAIMEPVEEQVGKHGAAAEVEEGPVSARRGIRPSSDVTSSPLAARTETGRSSGRRRDGGGVGSGGSHYKRAFWLILLADLF